MYAYIKQDLVCVIDESASIYWPTGSVIECGEDVRPGWTFTGQAFLPPVQPTPSRKLTKLDYMNRFTDAELAGIYTAAKTVVQVEIWLEKFKITTDVDLEDPRTVAGVEAMEGAGLLAAGRAAEILA